MVQFFETRLRIIFLLSPGETRSRLSYDHSRISRRERDSILLLSCFETRSRLQKTISRGRARKNEADSRREFPGSRILADLCYTFFTFVYFLPSVGQSCKNVQTVQTGRCYFFWPVLIFGESTRKTGENTRKQAKNRRFFGANFFRGKIGRC